MHVAYTRTYNYSVSIYYIARYVAGVNEFNSQVMSIPLAFGSCTLQFH